MYQTHQGKCSRHPQPPPQDQTLDYFLHQEEHSLLQDNHQLHAVHNPNGHQDHQSDQLNPLEKFGYPEQRID